MNAVLRNPNYAERANMTRETIDVLDRMWTWFELMFEGPGHHAHWRQESYRGEFFKAFATLYRTEPLHGDAVREFLRERRLPRQAARRKEKLDVLDEICDAWSEWKYAWDNFSQ